MRHAFTLIRVNREGLLDLFKDTTNSGKHSNMPATKTNNSLFCSRSSKCTCHISHKKKRLKDISRQYTRTTNDRLVLKCEESSTALTDMMIDFAMSRARMCMQVFVKCSVVGLVTIVVTRGTENRGDNNMPGLCDGEDAKFETRSRV